MSAAQEDNSWSNNYLHQYLQALLDADSDIASATIQKAFHDGIDAQSIYQQIICQAQIRLGELWLDHKITITNEHIATEIAMTQLSWLRLHAPKRTPLDLTVLVTTPSEEEHIFPARVVADLFLLDGWTVHFTGLNTPEDELLLFIEAGKPELVSFSLTMPPARNFSDFLKRIKKLPSPPLVAVGGNGSAALSDFPLIDIFAPRSISEIKFDKRFLGPNADEAGFLQLKNEIGQRIVTLRKDRKINQQDLAAKARIDRAYLSALENGKQNPSLQVLYRLALAMGVSLKELLET